MVHARIEAGCPLETLQIISAGAIDTESLSWLQKHAATVKYPKGYDYNSNYIQHGVDSVT
jgi:hypothetical protein